MHNRDGRTSKRRRHRLRSHQATTAALYTAANPTCLTAQPVIRDLRYQSCNTHICAQCCRRQAAHAHTTTAISRARVRNSSDKQPDFTHNTYKHTHKPHAFSHLTTPKTHTYAREKISPLLYRVAALRMCHCAKTFVCDTHTAFARIAGRGKHDQFVMSSKTLILAHTHALYGSLGSPLNRAHRLP